MVCYQILINLSGLQQPGSKTPLERTGLELIYSNGTNIVLERNLGERLLEQVPRSPTARQRK